MTFFLTHPFSHFGKEKSQVLTRSNYEGISQSQCARAKFNIGLLALYNYQFDLAEQMFQKAEKVEKSEIGRSYPMALWGAIMATAFDCKKGKGYLKRIPKEMNWITENEKMNIEIGFALYPPNCVKKTEEDKIHFHKTASKIREKYPKDIESELFYRWWSSTVGETSKKLQREGINFAEDVMRKDKKYNTHPLALTFIMRFYAYDPE